jgi:hypothetical protein
MSRDGRLRSPHYLALLEQKIQALNQAAMLAGWQLPERFAQFIGGMPASAF